MKIKMFLLTVILVFMTVFFPVLQSCEKDDSIINSVIESDNSSENSDYPNDSDNKASNIENKTLENKTELTSVKMQESTNKLVIYIHPFIENLLTPALNIFKVK